MTFSGECGILEIACDYTHCVIDSEANELCCYLLRYILDI